MGGSRRKVLARLGGVARRPIAGWLTLIVMALGVAVLVGCSPTPPNTFENNEGHFDPRAVRACEAIWPDSEELSASLIGATDATLSDVIEHYQAVGVEPTRDPNVPANAPSTYAAICLLGSPIVDSLAGKRVLVMYGLGLGKGNGYLWAY